VRHLELPPGLMPAGAVKQNNCMRAGRDVTTDLGEVQVHRLAVGHRQDQSHSGIARGADCSEQISPIVALVAGCARSAAALGPNPSQCALLADPGFILPPKLDRLTARVRRDDLAGKFFYAPPGWRRPVRDSVAAPISAGSRDAVASRRPIFRPV